MKLTELNSKAPLLVNDIDISKSILRNINWNFHQSFAYSSYESRPFNCRKHHWYPATFVPEIPFTLVEVLTKPGAVVYDPFAGIGTTYFQTLSLNRRPLATEISKVAVEFMTSMSILFSPKVDFKMLKTIIGDIFIDFDPDKDYKSCISSGILLDRLEPWYSKSTLNQLSFLFFKEKNFDDRVIRSVLRISLSAILKAVSSQDRGWGCVADNVLPGRTKKDRIRDKDVFRSFTKHTNTLLEDVSRHLKHVMPGYEKLYDELSKSTTIFQEDIREGNSIEDNAVDLVITSPPYPNMTDYINSQRLSYYYLGCDVSDKKNTKDPDLEIGSRIKRFRKDSLSCYFNDMLRANQVIANKIKTGGYACFVMPFFNTDSENNRDRKFIVQKLISTMVDYDLVKEDEYERIIPVTRRSHNMKWAKLEKEKIYLFRKV